MSRAVGRSCSNDAWKDVGIGVTGSYEGDQAELTGTALVGKRSLSVHVTLRKLAGLGAG